MKPTSEQANLLDPNDGIALRSFYESLRGQMQSDRSSWDAQWGQLAAFFAPRSALFNYSDANQGQRQDYNIINETGLLALRTLAAGMQTGMSSQTRKWFKIQADDPAVDELKNVREWCEEVDERVRKVFLKSNVYDSLLTMYSEEGLYGTSMFMVLEDERTVIRCYADPMGSYYLGYDDARRIDLSIRVISMTVRQIVERFGYENCSSAVQVLYDSPAGGVKETRYPIVRVIHKGSYFAPSQINPPMPWVTVWYEMGAFNEKNGVLRRSGFLECPMIVGRWKVTGENIYGESAGMDCLGSTMSLQAWEERTAQAAEKQINPPMIASSELDPRKVTTLPGDIIFSDGKDVSAALQSAYKVDFRLDGALAQIQRIENRINDAMYRSLFQMISESDRREVTAEEIKAKQQEKMQILGPVVERNIGEALGPLVQRTLSIMLRRGLLPPMPDELKDKPVKLEFISILAQAQKMMEANNLQQLMAFVGTEVAIAQEILDNFDLDKVARKAAELLDVSNEILRAPEQVQQMRASRAQQQQAAQTAENAEKLAGAARNMADSQIGTGSLLDQAMPAIERAMS